MRINYYIYIHFPVFYVFAVLQLIFKKSLGIIILNLIKVGFPAQRAKILQPAAVLPPAPRPRITYH